MKKELIDELFQKFEAACYLIENTECWSARELQTILGYAKWDNFLNAVEKAKNACEGAGEKVEHHFADVGKMVEIGSGTQRRIETTVHKSHPPSCNPLIHQGGQAPPHHIYHPDKHHI